MALDPAANFVRTTTAEAVDSTQTSITVADTAGFPDPSTDGDYNVVAWDAEQYPRPDQDANTEIWRVTAVDTGTDTLTVTRAQEGTAAASQPNGAAVHLSPTAKMFSEIQTKTQGLSDDGTTLDITQVNDNTGTAILGASVASGSIALSSGSATIDTGVGVGTTATFYVALGPDTDDADVAADIRAQSGGNYEVDIQETDTSVGNPTINYDVVRVR